MRKIILLFLLTATSAIAQKTVINGYVFDKINNEPLPYATVKLVGDVQN